MTDTDDIVVEDVTGFSGGKKSKKTFKSIVLDQYERCAIEGGKELTSGGVQKRFFDGQVVSILVPNQIQIYCNVVDQLKLLLYPQIQKEAATIGDKVNAFEDSKIKLLKWRKGIIKKIHERFQETSTYEQPDGTTERERSAPVAKQLIVSVENQYEQKIYELHKDLFGDLSFLMNKLNYFEESGSTS